MGLNKVSVIGIGPGKVEMMTTQAYKVLEECDVIVGYPVYLQCIEDSFPDKEMLSTPMRQETLRCQMAYERAMEGQKVALVCSGDSGVYGMASLMYELKENYPDCELEIIPGITAALSGGALLGAPLGNDFAVISLSDLLTPWELIEKRLRAAAQGDFCIAIYNPSSKKRADHLKRACEILLESLPEDRPCGYAVNIGREEEHFVICTLGELKEARVDMFTTVFVGNSNTVFVEGKMVTRRGYRL
ncbi:MAG: precorrin-3B C(17)-methyltransferase [Pseudobutyrivibrio sp.]|nr:precorrin-3B C(17)-methyltransferase [Pseudobutyrivibrio sp.]